jgi:integrase/recombinase XerD
MTDTAISPLRRRLSEDVTIRRLSLRTGTTISATSRSLPIFWAALLTRRPPRMSIAISCGWHRSDDGTDRQRRCRCPAVLRQGHTEANRSRPGGRLDPRPRRLPVILNPEEVGRLLASARNIEHKALLSLTYATGLRSSEVVSLKLTDIDSDRMIIRVEQGKEKKDRYVILSFNLLEILRERCRVAREGMDVSRSAVVVSRLPQAAHECASAPPDRSLGSGAPALPYVLAFTHCGTACHPSLGAKNRYPDHPGPARTQKLDTPALYTGVTISALGKVTSPLDFLLKMPG